MPFLIWSTLFIPHIFGHFIYNISALFQPFSFRGHNLHPYNTIRSTLLSDILIYALTNIDLSFHIPNALDFCPIIHHMVYFSSHNFIHCSLLSGIQNTSPLILALKPNFLSHPKPHYLTFIHNNSQLLPLLYFSNSPASSVSHSSATRVVLTTDSSRHIPPLPPTDCKPTNLSKTFTFTWLIHLPRASFYCYTPSIYHSFRDLHPILLVLHLSLFSGRFTFLPNFFVYELPQIFISSFYTFSNYTCTWYAAQFPFHGSFQ